jgi:hypothetical protein
MSQSYKYLHIDSKLRDIGSSHSYSVKIQPALRELKSARLVALNLPVTNFNVNETNNIIYVSDGGDIFPATITPGVYDIVTILPAIKTAIELTGIGGTIAATFSDLTLKLTITGTVNFSLNFSDITNSMAHLLGFPNVDTSLALSHTGLYSINLSIPPCVFIRINEFPVMCKSTTGISGTFPIYLNVISGEINFHFDKTHFNNESQGTISNINMMNVSLIDPRDGSEFSIQGNDWTMLLELN